MNTSLRKYQQNAVDSVLHAIDAGKKRVLFISPAGTGKLLTIASLIDKLLTLNTRQSPKFLFICDRQLLVQEALNLFRAESLRVSTDFDKDTSIHISTLQRIDNGKNISDASDYTHIIIYGTEYAGLNNLNSSLYQYLNSSSAVLLGVDSILDKSSLFFGEPVFEYRINEAIKDNVLLNYELIPIAISQESNESERLEAFANEILGVINETKTIVYCENQEIAKNLSGIINKKRKTTYAATVVTSEEENEVTINNFSTNDLPLILTTVNLLASRDLPIVRNIALTNLINSDRLLKQIVSKGMLKAPGKEYLRVIDFTGGLNKIDIDPIRILSVNSVDMKGVGRIEKEKLRFVEHDIPFRDTHNINGVLGVEELAQELSKIIVGFPKELGHLIGIFGRWGRGKTFLMNKIWLRLKDLNFKRVDLHAWKYQDTPALWAYLYEQFSTAYFDQSKHKLDKVWRRLRLNVARIGWWILLWPLTSFVLYTVLYFAFSLKDKIDFLTWSVKTVGWSVLLYPIIIYIRYGQTAKSLYSSYFGLRKFSHLMGTQAELQRELIYLLNTWKKLESQLNIVLFVDDIDRCSDKKVMEIIDSLRVMMEDKEISKHVVVIAAIDDQILKTAIKTKYSNLFGSMSPGVNSSQTELVKLTSEYIDKLFILGVKLGELSISERQEFFKELTKGYVEVSTKSNNSNSQSITTSLVTGNKVEEKPLEGEPVSAEPAGNPSVSTTSEIKTSVPLSQKEFEIISECLSIYSAATPRQLRILFYRYILVKNLLVRQYLSKENYWSITDNVKLLVTLIILYSKENNSHLIAEHRNMVALSRDQNSSIFFKEDTQAPREDYLKLLDVFDIVIAY